MMTGVGMILGTAAYMSPEQAKGRPADKRSDVWAFGCVLYEMLTGRRAFEGEDVSDTLAAVLRGEPDWVALPKDLPHTIGIIVRRCLEKDRRRRIGDISTATFLLNEPLAAPTPSTVTLVPVRASSRTARLVGAVSLAAIAGAAGAFAAWSTRPAPPSSIVTRFPLMLGEGQTFFSGLARSWRSRRTAPRSFTWPIAECTCGPPRISRRARSREPMSIPDTWSSHPTVHRSSLVTSWTGG